MVREATLAKNLKPDISQAEEGNRARQNAQGFIVYQCPNDGIGITSWPRNHTGQAALMSEDAPWLLVSLRSAKGLARDHQPCD